MPDLTGLPAEWQEGLSWLASGPVPTDHHEGRWRARVGDALRLASEWGVTARALGWDTLNLFGHEPNPLARRLDTMGLAALLKGRPVVAHDSETATILDPSGARMRFQRFPGRGASNPAPGSVPMWRLKGASLAPNGDRR